MEKSEKVPLLIVAVAQQSLLSVQLECLQTGGMQGLQAREADIASC